MKIFTDIQGIDIENKTVAVLGKFDGVHKGHQALIYAAQKIMKEENLKIAVFTFNFGTGHRNLLTTINERRSIFEKMNVDYLIECPFESIHDMEAEAFIDDIIIGRLNSQVMVAGTDCSFGRGRKGNASLAQKIMCSYGKRAVIINKVMYGLREISSTYVRDELSEGNITAVNGLLGYEYFVEGTVVKGNQIGRTLDFPTVNIIPEENKLLPPFGVYASHVLLNGKLYNGVTNIGVKPTVGSDTICVETYIFDFEGNAYGTKIRVMLNEFIRPEVCFPGLGELKMQIAADIRDAKKLLA